MDACSLVLLVVKEILEVDMITLDARLQKWQPFMPERR